jgi:hypothetical protein
LSVSLYFFRAVSLIPDVHGGDFSVRNNFSELVS